MKKIGVVLLLVLAGCGILNRSAKTSEKNFSKSISKTKLASAAQIESMKDRQELVYKKDSAAANYTIHFWPKGTLNFSADGKFTGEFDSVIMVGKQNQHSASMSLMKDNERASGRFMQEVNNTQLIKSGEENTRKTSAPDWKLLAIIVILLLVVLFFVAKKMVSVLKA